jgi:hypothetical protein
MTGTAIDTTRKIFATRNSATAWRDEDKAMAHESWGPFTSIEAARDGLVKAMRDEADYLDRPGTEDRRDAILTGADMVADGAERVEVAGLVWKISNWAW